MKNKGFPTMDKIYKRFYNPFVGWQNLSTYFEPWLNLV